jgi:NDP-sugar pyrophosphorylase family protein
MMRAVILAGGLGTRLRPYTTIIPKPLVPIGDRPILELLVARLAGAGVTGIDLCVSHLGELIQSYFQQAVRLPPEVEVRWHWEDEPLGTAGALRVVPDLEGSFLALNGDLLTTLDFRALMDFHAEQEAALTIAMRREEVAIELGVIDAEGDRVVGYREKPTLSYEVSMGIYAYDARALRHLPAGGPCQFPDFVLRLLDAGEKVAAFRSDADWYDIGTFDEHERATRDVVSRPEVFAP